MALEIKDLCAKIEGKEILKGVNITIQKGEIHALMGPNGSGKSTLANVLMGHPKYEVTSGQVLLNGEDLTDMEPHERAKAGLFLSFQYPVEIPGVTVENFLRTAYNEIHEEDLDVVEFHKLLKGLMEMCNIREEFSQRYLNEGFSGGEKKRMEILQMLTLSPQFAVLDETDSGLDVDALKVVSEGINKLHTGEHGILLITHYNRILSYVVPDQVHVLVEGKIVQSGGKDLAVEVEEKGYEVIL